MDAKLSIRIDEFDYLSPGGTPLAGRLYRPHRTDVPAVIDVHGGKWTQDDRHKNWMIAEPLAAAGIAVFSIDFRMPPEASYPASVCDIHAAVRWLKSHAAELGIREDAIGGFGASSGGHQILLTALCPGATPFGQHVIEGNADARLKFLMTGWPVVDPSRRFVFAKDRSLDDLITAHQAYWQPLSRMDEGNPQRWLDENSFTDLPPLLILQGLADENFEPVMVEEFAKTYQEKGGMADYVPYDGEPHAFMNRNIASEASQDALARMVAFVREQTNG